MRYVAALGLTLLVEVPLYTAALVGWLRLTWRPAFALAIGVNLATHPLLWWSLRPWAGDAQYPWLLAGAEVAVCAVEWALFTLGVVTWRRRHGRRALDRLDVLLLGALSVGVNAASVIAGTVIVSS